MTRRQGQVQRERTQRFRPVSAAETVSVPQRISKGGACHVRSKLKPPPDRRGLRANSAGEGTNRKRAVPARCAALEQPTPVGSAIAKSVESKRKVRLKADTTDDGRPEGLHCFGGYFGGSAVAGFLAAFFFGAFLARGFLGAG